MNRKCLLLGGSGYLGSHIAERFSNEDNIVIVIGDILEPIDSAFECIKIDVLNKEEISSAIQQFDVIINCTGQVTTPINTCFRINTEGIENIVGAVNEFNKKLVHISTVSVYGTTEYADENSDLNPESTYATCKSFAEYQIRKSLSEEKFCILRLSNLYGGNASKGLFAYILNSHRSNKELHYNNDGTLSRYFLHVDDCSEAIFRTIQKKLIGCFNISSTEKYNLKEIISIIEEISNTKFAKYFDQMRPIENIDKLNSSSFHKISGFTPRYSLKEFLNNTFLRHV